MAVTIVSGPTSQRLVEEPESLDEMATRLIELKSKAAELQAVLEAIDRFESKLGFLVLQHDRNGRPLPIPVHYGGRDWRVRMEGGRPRAKLLPLS